MHPIPSMPRRRGLIALACLGAAPLAARAQGWPSRPVRLIVPYAPGGGTDYFARALAEALQARLGQAVVVDNRPGAGTIIGAQELARAAPDGHALLLGDSATFAINPALHARLPYEPARDFTPVTLTGRFSLLLVVNPAALKADSVAQLVEQMKRRPGEINYGSPGSGSPHHLAMELLAQRVGGRATHIAYKGTGPAMSDLLGGQISTMYVNLATVAPHLKSGRLKALAVSGDKRIATLPDVPTVAEAGVPGYEAWAWQGVVAPAGAPREVVARLVDAYRQIVAEPAFRQKMINEAGIEPMHSTGAEMAAYMAAERSKWARVVKEAGIQPD